MASIDELMRKDVLELSDHDIEETIKYIRQHRNKLASGEKPPKPSKEQTTLSHEDIMSLLDKKVTKTAPTTAPSTTGFTRRILG